MLIEYLNGEVVDMDPTVVALDTAIYRALERHGATKQARLWFRVKARNYGVTKHTDPKWLEAIERLVQKRLILRSVQRRNSFLLRITPRAQREGQPCS